MRIRTCKNFRQFLSFLRSTQPLARNDCSCKSGSSMRCAWMTWGSDSFNFFWQTSNLSFNRWNGELRLENEIIIDFRGVFILWLRRFQINGTNSRFLSSKTIQYFHSRYCGGFRGARWIVSLDLTCTRFKLQNARLKSKPLDGLLTGIHSIWWSNFPLPVQSSQSLNSPMNVWRGISLFCCKMKSSFEDN